MLMKLLRQRLGLRLALVCFSLSIGMAVLVTTLQVYSIKQEAQLRVTDLFREIQQSFIPPLTEAMWTMDPVRTHAQLEAMSSLATMGWIELTDDSGQVTRLEESVSVTPLAEQVFPLNINIEGQEFALGSLKIVLDSAAIDKRIREVMTNSLITAFLVTLGSSFLLVWLFHHWVVLQLQQVSSYASQLNAENLAQELVLKKPTAPDDEIGKIVSALTEMQQKLLQEFEKRAVAEEELKAHQARLEVIVDERTRQLVNQAEALEVQSKALTQQNMELNAFAHTVAHDLKHPVTSLIGTSTLLSKAFDSLDRTQQQDFLQQILQSSLKMNAMINGLLQLASLRANETPDFALVNIQLTVQDALNSLAVLIAETKPLITIQPNLPVVRTYGQWIEEIWLNYLSNAIKYGGHPAMISIGFRHDSQTGFTIFWVDDRGPGIMPEQASKLFTEFHRLHTERKDSHGLGLSIVQRICNKLGGQCGYERNAQGGSRFWFSLPVAVSPETSH